MNNYFIKKIEDLKDKHETEGINYGESTEVLKKFVGRKLDDEEFRFNSIDENKLKQLLKMMKGKKACGVDWICGYSLKIASQELLPELLKLVNLSLQSGKFGSAWKRSKVLPGFKNKGSRCDAKFYRPVSNLSELSKLVERAAHEQVYDYVTKNGLIHENHHGFLKHCSTSTALQQITDIWLQAIYEG